MLTYTTASLTKHLNQKGETTMKSLAIEREFGSGGREIGMRVAELAGIPYYDGELLIKAAEAQGVSIELLKTYDEQRTGSFLYDIAAFSDYARNRKNTVYELFEGIRRTMVNIELKGPAVFIGRCSTVILGESPRVLKSFIYSSDTEKRVERIIRTENVSETDAKYLMQKKDRDRKNYFRFWTQKEWADKSNYDILLNTSGVSTEACAQMLLAAISGAVPKSKKLLQFTLDDGTGVERTILSGIHAFYEPEELVGKTLIAITNLPPRAMMGIESCGMLLSAIHEEEGEEKLHLLMVDDHIPAGAKLY